MGANVKHVACSIELRAYEENDSECGYREYEENIEQSRIDVCVPRPVIDGRSYGGYTHKLQYAI